MYMLDQLNRLASFSTTDPDGEGVTRLPFTQEQIDAARFLQDSMKELGMETRVDAYGTVAGFVKGQSEQVLVIGSHYDSVPRGGRYDGCAGVIAGLNVVRRLREAGETPYYSLLVLGLNDEEGVRLNEGFLSSHSVCGFLSKEDETRVHDRKTGETLGEFLDASPFSREPILLPENTRAYVEFHIEQGPVLDEEGGSIAIVDHIVGVYHCFYELHGVQNHAGTTPMLSRVDPIPVFGRIAAALPEVGKKHPASVATIGFVDVQPNSPNVIPKSVRFSVDLRCTDPDTLQCMIRETEELARAEAAAAKMEILQIPSTDAAPVIMDSVVVNALEKCVKETGLPVRHMDSGAGHDAQIFAQRVPTAMLFARSRGGLSHCKEEYTAESDLENAAEILYQLSKERF